MTKISELTSIVTAAATDIIAVVQGGVTKNATVQDYRDAGIIPTADQAAALAAYQAALAAAEADQVLTATGPGVAAFEALDLGTAAAANVEDFDAAGAAAAAQAAAIAALDGGEYFGVVDSTKTIRAGEFRTKPRTARALVTIMFDDGTETDYTLMYPLFVSKGIVGASAIITDYPGNQPGYMSWSQIADLSANGWEIVSHGKTATNFTTFTEAQLTAELTNTQADFEAQGLEVTNLVYPEHGSNEMVRRVARNYYRSARGQAGFTGTNRLNLELLETFNLRSVNIDDHTLLADYKDAVDDCETAGRWLIFYAHGTTADDVTAIGELIDYIQEKSIDIVTMAGALDILGNVLDISDSVAIRDNAARVPLIEGDVEIGNDLYIGGDATIEGATWLNKVVGGTANIILQSLYSTWTYPKFNILGDGKLEWGAGSTAPVDTNLYRLSANNLKTDDNLTVAGNLTVGIGLFTNMRASTNAFPANKVNIAPSATAVLTVDIANTYPAGFIRVYAVVAYSSSTGLQSHLQYQLLTVESVGTGGGGTAIAQVHDDSTGNFLVQTANFAVTRPSNGRIVITYTCANPSGNNNINFFVEGVGISSVAVT